MDIRTEYVTVPVSDGTSMRLYVARPGGAAPQRGIMVLQEAFGVNAHVRDVTERFARQGFLAVAPELFHRTGAGWEGQYTDFPSAMAHLKELRDPNMEADLKAAYGWLRSSGLAENAPIAAIGYCMGGRAAVLASITLPLAAAVSYYGGGIAPNPMNPGLLGRLKDLHSPVLLVWGGSDTHVTTEHSRQTADALTAAGKSFVNVTFSDADHGFFCDARASYNPVAAGQVWPLTLAFLNTHASAHEPMVAAQ